MTLSFAKPPLVEIVVELRWTPTQSQISISPLFGNSALDEFYMRLAGKLHQQGFQAIERLIPPGFPMMLHQPIYRYKKATEPATVLCQAGAGIFAVNGVPPYKSWKEFFPVVKGAIATLLESRDSSEKASPFSSISLRYIDAFSHELRGGKNTSEFLSEILGISLSLPHALSQFVKGKAPQYALQLILPVSDEAILTINFAEAVVNGNPAVLMDTTSSCTKGVEPNLDNVVRVLNSAHDIVHAMFVEITDPIHKLMQPMEQVMK